MLEGFETDYLIVGAGATGLAFADTLLEETDAHLTLVDRRDRPGGHWIDAYPFVRLHQPSSFYGVASKLLGTGSIEQFGLNAGYEELAGGAAIAAYYQALIQDRFLPSGRVRYLPMCEHLGDGEIRHRLSGTRLRVRPRRRRVAAGYSENQIPLTHQRRFHVADEVECIPPNELPRRAPNYGHFVILGAGKTAMDCAIWLLENDAVPDQITWVMPRDPWVINRAFTQAGAAFFQDSYGGAACQLEALAKAHSVEDFSLRMEDAGLWMRIDPSIRADLMHGSTLSDKEMAFIRRIASILREGRVQEIAPGRMRLAGGTHRTPQNALYIDCTASALRPIPTVPIFDGSIITPQMVRLYQPTFSAALIARTEAMKTDDAAKNALARPIPMTDTVESWIGSQRSSMMNQHAWSENEELRPWMRQCRLEGFGRAGREVDRDAPEVQAIFARIRKAAIPALQNMGKLLAE